MRILIVEDDFISRKVMLSILSKYAECDVAVDGKEAVKAYRISVAEHKRYDLICLDIMMPEKDGYQVLKEVREFEISKGFDGLSGVKVIMTTALSEPKNIFKAFREQCEAYIVKPVDEERILKTMKDLGLKFG